MERKQYIEEIGAFQRNAFLCIGCQKENSFEGGDELELAVCPSCNTPLLRPKKIARFWLFKLLNQNESGNIYLAYHEELPYRLFTVKILPRDLKEDSLLGKKLQKEADLVRKLGNHPCFFPGIESGIEEGEHYFAMENREGEGLDKRLENLGPLPEIESLTLILRLLSAEAHLYNCGFLYRNLRPEKYLAFG